MYNKIQDGIDMKKIIVAGAGHGGLTAAAELAKNGFDVTVIEKNFPEKMGHDWHDSMRKSTFEKSGVPLPDDEFFFPMENVCYYNPKKSVKLTPDKDQSNIVYIDRKVLIAHLLSYAEDCGVKFIFGTQAVRGSYSKSKVKGIVISDGDGEKELSCDMIIDAAGMFSPIRRSIPECTGIKRDLPGNDVFCVWRGYFEKTENILASPPFSIYFYHCSHPGMDWAITRDSYVDVLVGGFSALSEKNVSDALADFNREYPFMKKNTFRGGSFETIPLGKTPPVLVYDGYALVGDSAVMTEPLSGSGIDLSMKAGKLLADTIIKAGGDFSREALWEYNYEYFRQFACKYYNDLIIKSFLSEVDSDDIDFFLEEKIMTEKEVAGGGRVKYSIPELLSKLNVVKRPRLLIPLSTALEKIILLEAVKKTLPEKYNSKKVLKWKRIYDKI